MRPTLALRMLAAALLVSVSTPVVPQASAAELTDTGHVPGDAGFGVDLPADTAWAGKDGETHPCAGRKLLYHSHNDALYGTRVGGELTVMAVDGQQVVDQDAVCFRLPRDADPDGNEVSRIQIPDDGSLDFLGDPGDTVWIAPQSVDWSDNWRPIWSGLGAFDPAHEGNPEAIPSNFTDDLMHFDLTEMEGPGEVQIFFKNAISPAEIVFNSADPRTRTVDYEVGAHGHFNWTFTKPGIYAMTWQGRAVLDDGTSQRTDPITQYWLVGDDSDVGLTDGTTTELRKVTNYVGGDPGPGAENDGDSDAPLTTVQLLPDASGDDTGAAEPRETTESDVPTVQPAQPPIASRPSGVGQASGTEASTSASPRTPEAAPKDERCEAAIALRTKPSALIGSGHMDMGLVDDGGIEAKLIDDSDPRSPTPRDSGTFLFEVPSTAKTEIPASFRSTFPGEPESMWVLPQAQVKGLPWLGFSTTRLSANSLQQGSKVTATMRDVRGPGRIFTWHEGLSGTTLELDSGDSAASLEYGLNDHDHQAFGFTKAGFYSATFAFTGTDASGATFTKDLTATFAVGDEAVKQAKEYSSSGYRSLADVNVDDCDNATSGADNQPAASDTWLGALAKGIRDIDKEFATFGDKAGPFFAHLLGRDDTGQGGQGKTQTGNASAAARSSTARSAPTRSATARATEAQSIPAQSGQAQPARRKAAPSNQASARATGHADTRRTGKQQPSHRKAAQSGTKSGSQRGSGNSGNGASKRSSKTTTTSKPTSTAAASSSGALGAEVLCLPSTVQIPTV